MAKIAKIARSYHQYVRESACLKVEIAISKPLLSKAALAHKDIDIDIDVEKFLSDSSGSGNQDGNSNGS